ncbi:hypothetical protein DOTSEDRAFT_74202 [Dothistroma septosporum NZE10]|uniref:Uncharacterized protein n=1 Tax=Dothistroma septosporum (strain NZE10 / CBS 128990) TaxID=675120 RepID=N1PDY0_DOTSN|nr:hypothetical protein DOTSEDRAFT_74202 [Dothistroma septosporum NZE10]
MASGDDMRPHGFPDSDVEQVDSGEPNRGQDDTESRKVSGQLQALYALDLPLPIPELHNSFDNPKADIEGLPLWRRDYEPSENPYAAALATIVARRSPESRVIEAVSTSAQHAG